MPRIDENDIQFNGYDDIKLVEEFTGGTTHDNYLCDPKDMKKCYCMVNIPEGDSFYQLKLYPGVHIIKNSKGKFTTFPISLKATKEYKERFGKDLEFFSGGI